MLFFLETYRFNGCEMLSRYLRLGVVFVMRISFLTLAGATMKKGYGDVKSVKFTSQPAILSELLCILGAEGCTVDVNRNLTKAAVSN